jgi:hypothetical protein
MQKTYLFSLQIGMPQANALNSIGYMDTVPFLTIGKPDISRIRISYRFYMHLQAAFLFAKEIGTFFALTALDLLN